jgi:DNA repair ATPase RecN
MSKKGFYLQKLRVVGGAVNPAEVSFGSGLNVISGSSNTGKSYICSCIDFMLGASTPPEPIPESNDYSEILLEIKTYEGHTYTLKRPIKQKSDAILYECDIENVEKTIGNKL